MKWTLILLILGITNVVVANENRFSDPQIIKMIESHMAGWNHFMAENYSDQMENKDRVFIEKQMAAEHKALFQELNFIGFFSKDPIQLKQTAFRRSYDKKYLEIDIPSGYYRIARFYFLGKSIGKIELKKRLSKTSKVISLLQGDTEYFLGMGKEICGYYQGHVLKMIEKRANQFHLSNDDKFLKKLFEDLKRVGLYENHHNYTPSIIELSNLRNKVITMQVMSKGRGQYLPYQFRKIGNKLRVESKSCERRMLSQLKRDYVSLKKTRSVASSVE